MHEKENEDINIKNDNCNGTAESRDFSQDINKDGLNTKNIDFKYLKEKLNKNVYDDERLTVNAINHTRISINYPVEILWETGNKNKIINKSIGTAKSVDLSISLILRAKKDERTLQILHNHTSGTPLPHPEDILNMIKYKIVNSGISGNYGFLNIKNSFKQLNKNDIINIEIKLERMFDELNRDIFKENPLFKYESKELRKIPKYKYYKENINEIIKKYNKEFKEYGIEFKHTHYKLKK